MSFIEKVIEIMSKDIKYGTAYSAEIDYFMPMPEDHERIIGLFNLVKKNMKEALTCKNEYVKAFARMTKRESDMFMRGDENFQKQYPNL